MALVAALVLAGVGVGWSLAHVTDKPAAADAGTARASVAVTEGELSDTLPLTVLASWATDPLAMSRAAGVVTSVAVRTGQQVDAGDELFAVNLAPVLVAEGAVPLFRDVGGSNQRGPDVKQVQAFLRAGKFYAGPIDGVCGPGTARAILAWQQARGLPRTGLIRPADVLMVPKLPVRVQVLSKLRVGTELAGGEALVRAFRSAPSFKTSVSDRVAAQLAQDVPISVDADGSTWTARAGKVTQDKTTGETYVELLGVKDGQPVCGAACAKVPFTGAPQFAGSAVLLAPLTGPLVPSAAIGTDASGSPVVTLEDGSRVSVQVKGSSAGMASVTGLQAGQRVRVPGDAAG